MPRKRPLPGQNAGYNIGTTWVQRHINSNFLIFEPTTCVAACAATFWSPPTKSHSKVFWKVGSSGAVRCVPPPPTRGQRCWCVALGGCPRIGRSYTSTYFTGCLLKVSQMLHRELNCAKISRIVIRKRGTTGVKSRCDVCYRSQFYKIRLGLNALLVFDE